MNKKEFIGLNLLLFILLCMLIPNKGHDGDLGYWRNWASLIYESGFASIYNFNDVNYHPLFLYMLKLYDLYYHDNNAIWVNIGQVKIFALIFDFAGLFALKIVMDKFQIAYHKSFFLLLNIAYLYNSLIWGQVDSIYTNLCVISICLMLIHQPIISVLFFVLAINAKMQAVFFLPIIGILWLNQFQFRKACVALIAAFALHFLIISPFIFGGSLAGLLNVIKGAEDYYPVISMNAHNWWYWIYPYNTELMGVSDKETFMTLSAKSIGKLLFLVSCFCCLWPMFRLYLKGKLLVDDKSTWQFVFLVSILVTISFFFFNTQMHERYSHPIIICSFMYGLVSRKYDLYILSSLAYFLNLEKVMRFFNLQYQTLIFEPRFIATLFAIIIVIAFYRLSILYRGLSVLNKPN
jgi:Gpi18-like mannosyltransferase